MIFTSEDIKGRLREQPFRPVQVITSTGQSFDIFHPDLIWVGNRWIMVGIPNSSNPTVPDLATRISLVHLVELRDLPGMPTGANGDGK